MKLRNRSPRKALGKRKSRIAVDLLGKEGGNDEVERNRLVRLLATKDRNQYLSPNNSCKSYRADCSVDTVLFLEPTRSSFSPADDNHVTPGRKRRSSQAAADVNEQPALFALIIFTVSTAISIAADISICTSLYIRSPPKTSIAFGGRPRLQDHGRLQLWWYRRGEC